MNKINHVAIIMDGNGRWGLQKRKSRNYGHLKGLNAVEAAIKVAIKNEIAFLTLYTFSTENWKRPKDEINFLFDLIRKSLKKNLARIKKQKKKGNVIGMKKGLPDDIKKTIKFIEKRTKNNNKITINLALNYGAKEEIINACKKLAKEKKINIKKFESKLYTKNMPFPDILIRTGGTKRLSNFLLWQLAYTEIFFINELWPEFNEHIFSKIIKKFNTVKRNYGKI